MSGTDFLRLHGWKLGRELWWHDRLAEYGHSFDLALLQQAQWLEQDRANYGRWIRKVVDLFGQIEGSSELAGTDIGIRMSKLLCEVP